MGGVVRRLSEGTESGFKVSMKRGLVIPRCLGERNSMSKKVVSKSLAWESIRTFPVAKGRQPSPDSLKPKSSWFAELDD